jgi:hypothetical protein
VAAHFLWDAYRENVPEAERVTYVERHLVSESDPHFTDYCQHSSDNERIVLTTLALRGSLDRRGLSTAALAGIERALARLGPVAGQLQKRSLAVTRAGQAVLFSPIFEDWIVDEVFDLVGTADHDFDAWLAGASTTYAPAVREILPRVNPAHRSWVGKWLSDEDATPLIAAIEELVGGA